MLVTRKRGATFLLHAVGGADLNKRRRQSIPSNGGSSRTSRLVNPKTGLTQLLFRWSRPRNEVKTVSADQKMGCTFALWRRSGMGDPIDAFPRKVDMALGNCSNELRLCRDGLGEIRLNLRFGSTSGRHIMWNLGKLQVFPAGSSSPRDPRAHCAVDCLTRGKTAF